MYYLMEGERAALVGGLLSDYRFSITVFFPPFSRPYIYIYIYISSLANHVGGCAVVATLWRQEQLYYCGIKKNIEFIGIFTRMDKKKKKASKLRCKF